jgi:hypothetical protein
MKQKRMTTDKNGSRLKVGSRVKVALDFDSSVAVFNGAMGVIDFIDKIGQCCVLLDTDFLNNLIIYNHLRNTHWKTENPFYFYGEHLVRVDCMASLLDNE